MNTLIIALVMQMASGSAAGLQPEKPAPKPTPTSQPPIAPSGQTATSSTGAPARQVARTMSFRTADELLTALETADMSLRTLTAGLSYDRTFALQGDRQLRQGKLYFVSNPTMEQVVPPRRERKFAIQFDQLLVGTRIEKETKLYIFDGIWLVEQLPEQKIFVKRQIVPAGQPFDPLRIGEGPLPIPIGQRKNEILSRYNAELLASDSGFDTMDPKEAREAKAFVAGTQQLRLTPRPELERDSEFREIRLWYGLDKNGVLLPRMAHTLNQAEDESMVRLINVKVNAEAEIPADLFATKTPEAGWDVKIMEWRDGPENVGFVEGPQVVPADDAKQSPAGGAGKKPGGTSPSSAAPANPQGKPAELPKEQPAADKPPATKPKVEPLTAPKPAPK